MTRPSLTIDQLLRIEALKIANSLPMPSEYGFMPPEMVTQRADAYLTFLKNDAVTVAQSSDPSQAPQTSVRPIMVQGPERLGMSFFSGSDAGGSR
jgi:hypothetical protein